jgi:energy-coupling factor transporter ATP-binding protein EcfA2
MTNLTFNLHTLGWHSFQQLCHSILRESLGQTVESFLDVNDGGRDGAFCGTWARSNAEVYTGKFVVQCKFTNKPSKTLRVSDVSDEITKVKRLVARELCDVYVLLTNAGISGNANERIIEQLYATGIKHVLIFDGTWIEQQIRENKNLRSMVPRVYGLGDLSQILDERAYEQAAAVLNSMRDDLAKVVMTESYQHAARALDAHGFVLLIGEPAAGKTTVASLLAMASADKWGAPVIKASSAKELIKHWNPQENSQFFWVDDAFGVTQYESELASDWNHALPQMKAMIKHGSRIVMTSRDYIYRQARQRLKEGEFPLLQESQTVIDVQDLTAKEREQILYNHLKLGRQAHEFLKKIKPFLPDVANHRRFIPEIARRLSEPMLTGNLSLSARSLERFVEQRESFLIDVCEKLDVDCKAALALVYMRRSNLQSPIELAPEELTALQRHGSDLGGCTAALKVLDGSLLTYSTADGEAFWSFKHPTIGDAYATILRSNPELLGIYVQGTDVDRLMRQVTCGDMQIEGAVILPRSLFTLMTERVQSFRNSISYKSLHLSIWDARRQVKYFLAERCSKEFLETYLRTDPGIIEDIDRPSTYLEFSEDVNLAIRMSDFGILPEHLRQSLVELASERATEGGDPHILVDARFHALMTSQEASRLNHNLRTLLLPKIDSVRISLEEQHQEDGGDPEWHMRRLLQHLAGIAEHFPTSRRIQNLMTRIHAWIALQEQHIENDPEDTSHNIAVKDVTLIASEGRRNIFDDIAE